MTDHRSNDQFTPNPAQQPDVHFVLQAAEVGTWDLDIVQQQVWWDERCKVLFGFDKDDLVPYPQVLSYIHPDDQSRVHKAVQWALNPHSQGRYDIQFRTLGATDGRLRWLHCRGRAFFDEQGVAYRFSGIAQDTTQLVEARQQLDSSEARFADLINATPAATAVFVGRDMLIQQVNPPMLAIWGKDPSVMSKTLHVAMPELVGQPFLAQLQHVFDTGQPFRHSEGVAQLIENGQPKTVWFNHAYNPLYDQRGQIYGVINTAIEVTDQVLARQQLEESKAGLQNAIELAELGTWRMNCQTGQTHLSPRHAEMFGLEVTQLPFEQAFLIVHPDDRPQVRTAFEAAMQLGSDGHYQADYRIIHGRSGQLRHIRARGETRFAEGGQPVSITGTAQDVTLEHEMQSVLQTQVQQRTQELTLANQDLTRSNDNLQQFAYVASHDLQEPLRKIQSFSTLLEQQSEGQLTELGQTYLQRITSAAARMSTLIKDLLSYSRIATRQQAYGPISLDAVLAHVLETLSLEIEQHQARIELDELPVVNGDHSQLSQLFQNLLSNALKFTPPGQPPQVRVEYFQRQVGELPSEVRPNREAPFYHQISVRDQGVGFDPKYRDRIFQVFQRLHGKQAFPGTGVGLAICQRVVENHGGSITANSTPGEGATFCVYLPA